MHVTGARLGRASQSAERHAAGSANQEVTQEVTQDCVCLTVGKDRHLLNECMNQSVTDCRSGK